MASSSTKRNTIAVASSVRPVSERRALIIQSLVLGEARRCYIATSTPIESITAVVRSGRCCVKLTAVRLRAKFEVSSFNRSRDSSSSSSRNEYYLGGIIALLLQDHRTVSLKTVCSSQYMVTEYDQHWATGAQIKHRRRDCGFNTSHWSFSNLRSKLIVAL